MTASDAERALRTALSRGGDFAELFWERHETLQLVLDDGRIEDAITGVDQGAGVRVTTGDRTIYANGNVTDADDVLALAGRAAASVSDGGELHEGARLMPDHLERPHSVAVDPRTVPVERKVALLRQANEIARAVDARVVQATVSYGESVQEVVVAKHLLKAFGLRAGGMTLVACPSCGRAQVDVFAMAERVEKRLREVKADITVAVKGCAVNGPGEARDADVGLAGGNDAFLLFRKGEIVKKFPPADAEERLVEEALKIAAELEAARTR